MESQKYDYDLFICHSSANISKVLQLSKELEERFDLRCCLADRDFNVGKEIVENISDCMEQSDKISKVLQLSKELEERFDLRCCLADRDFNVGKEIVENISDCMEQSDKILILLSPEYVKSGWCWFEQQEAFRKYVEEKRECIIPVMLERVEEIPKMLRNITYIDVEKELDLAEKINEAFHQIGSTKTHVPYQLKEMLQTAYMSNTWEYLKDDSESNLDFFLSEIQKETDLAKLKPWFLDALKQKNLQICKAIIGKNGMVFQANVIAMFLQYFWKEKECVQMAECMYLKLGENQESSDLKSLFRIACALGLNGMVDSLLCKGCKDFIDASFLQKVITDQRFFETSQNTCIKHMLEEMDWNYRELESFFESANIAQNEYIFKVLLSTHCHFSISNFISLIVRSDNEDFCIHFMEIQCYTVKELANYAIFWACSRNMVKLVQKMIRNGVKPDLSLMESKFDDKIEEVLVNEVNWKLEELNELKAQMISNQRYVTAELVHNKIDQLHDSQKKKKKK